MGGFGSGSFGSLPFGGPGAAPSPVPAVIPGTLVPTTFSAGSPGAWRPPQWANSSNIPALTMLNTQDGTLYIFDSCESIDHDQEQVITLNPVQTGAAISDHAYVVPIRVTATILMSDSMQSFTVGQFANGPSRSVAAYQTLLTIQNQHILLTIATRLQPLGYQNMEIASLRAEETKDTRFAGRFVVAFQQIITASVEQVSTTVGTVPADYNPNTDSTRPQTTAGQTITGQTQTTPIPQSIQQQNNTTNAPASANLSSVPSVSGSGDWGSSPVASGGF